MNKIELGAGCDPKETPTKYDIGSWIRLSILVG